MDLNHAKRVGIAAAYEGGRILHRYFGQALTVHKKGAVELVTEADRASENAILTLLGQSFPEHGVLAEESGAAGPNNALFRWIVDPLDGTTNFAHRLSLFGVSIALARGDEPVVGVVLNPISGELFTAVRGGGAELNGQPIHVSDAADISESLLVTGFPYDRRHRMADLMARFSRCLAAARGVRRLGSAAMDLCYIACGRFEGFWEENLKPWDTAAGALIAAEAGAAVTDFADRPWRLDSAQILATNGRIHAQLLPLLDIKEME